VGGSHDLFSSFNRLSGTLGNTDYLVDYSRRQSDGERKNGQYTLNTGDTHLGSKLTDTQHLSFDFHAYSLESGLAGLMSYAQFEANRHQTTTPDDLLNTARYSGILTYEVAFGPKLKFTQKVWAGYQDLFTRSDVYSGTALRVTGGTLAEQRFHFTGSTGVRCFDGAGAMR
jgi:outer membrane receptor for Fe3+-dicitrate